jgi:hypothetical protein
VVVVGPEGPDDVSGSTGSIGVSSLEQNAWKLPSALTVPAETTLLFQSCYVFLADGTDDNIIRNSDTTNGNDNISILGHGRPILDGNASNQNRSGTSPSFLGLRFVHCSDLEIRGLKVINTAAWAIKPEAGDHITVEDIRFDQDNSQNNQDGVHPCGPIKHLEVRDIGGKVTDDIVALSSHSTNTDFVEVGGDIERFDISGIVTTDDPSVKLVPGDGNNIGRGSIEGGNFQFSIKGRFAATNANKDEVFNIDVTSPNYVAGGASIVDIDSECSNITFNGGTVINGDVTIRQSCDNITFTNFDFLNGGQDAFVVESGHTVNGLTITGGSLGEWLTQGGVGTAFKFAGTVNGLNLSGVTVRKATTVFDFTGTVSGVVDGIEIDEGNVTTVYNALSNVRLDGAQMPAHDSAPPNVEGTVVKASSTWDPDGDGNGELVIGDGTNWNEMADMPAI